MLLETAILRDLSSGQSTAGAVADRLRIHPEAALAGIRLLLAAGRVEERSIDIGGKPALSVFLLSESEAQKQATK